MGLDLQDPQDKKRHIAAIESILEACHRTGKIPGISLGSASDAQFWLDRGFRIVGAGEDASWALAGAAHALEQLATYRE